LLARNQLLTETVRRAPACFAARACALLGLLSLGFIVPRAAAQSTPPDAVIELWSQHWTLNADGSTAYHEKKHVRLNNDRAYGAFADPRIAFDRETDRVEIITARTKRPDGTYVDVPGYSRNEVSPGGDAAWPAFASLRHLVLTMSAIEPGCVVELEYRLASKPRPGRPLARDLRLDDRFPIQSRVISLEYPEQETLQTYFPGELAPSVRARVQKLPDRHARLATWDFGALPARPDEPHAPPWRTRPARRFAFTTAGDPAAWRALTIARIGAAADESPALATLANEWTRDHAGDADKLRAIHEKLAATFNFVDLDPEQRPAALRPASATIECNYGQPEEAAALFLALARAAGLSVHPALVVSHTAWLDQAPQDAFVTAYAVQLGQDQDAICFDARRGRISRDVHWAGSRILIENGSSRDLDPWTDPAESRLDLTGRLKIEPEGTFAGSVSLRASGLFAAGDALRTRADQERRVRELIDRALPQVKTTDVSLVTLTPTTLEAKARVERSEPLQKLDGAFLLELPAADPFESAVALPLGAARRENAVQLAGAFEQRVALTFAWPRQWTLEAAPQDRPAASFNGGSIAQTVTRVTSSADPEITVVRTLKTVTTLIEAADFATLHAAISDLRSAAQRAFVWRP